MNQNYNFQPRKIASGGPHAESGRNFDAMEASLRAAASRTSALSYTADILSDLPPWIDHSVHVKYIREQGAYACGLNAQAACWDILLAKYCPPYIHPNISVNRLIWGWSWTLRCWPENKPCNQRTTQPIPASGGSYKTLDEYLYGFGCPTEGTELTNSDGIQWPTEAGDAECPNYRIDRHPQAVAPNFHRDVQVDLNELKYWLKGGPVRISLTKKVFGVGHFVVLVGYDDATKKLKYLNSWGDRWGENGFGYLDYSMISQEIESAQVYQFVPPQPVPCVRIRFNSQWRQDVHLWVGIEGTNLIKRIWPSGQRQDNSWNLWLTVTLPAGFAWPPGPGKQIFLDVYDAGSHSNAGGAISEFSAHFGDQHRFCSEILQGIPDPDDPGAPGGIVPRKFLPRQLVHLTIQ